MWGFRSTSPSHVHGVPALRNLLKRAIKKKNKIKTSSRQAVTTARVTARSGGSGGAAVQHGCSDAAARNIPARTYVSRSGASSAGAASAGAPSAGAAGAPLHFPMPRCPVVPLTLISRASEREAARSQRHAHSLVVVQHRGTAGSERRSGACGSCGSRRGVGGVGGEISLLIQPLRLQRGWQGAAAPHRSAEAAEPVRPSAHSSRPKGGPEERKKKNQNDGGRKRRKKRKIRWKVRNFVKSYGAEC